MFKKVDTHWLAGVLTLPAAIVGICLLGRIEAAPMYPPFLPPGGGHLLGTDNSGRDLLALFFKSAAISLALGVGAALAATLIGALAGCVAGYRRSVVGEVLMRLIDMVMLIPTLPLVIVIAAYLGPGVENVFLVIALTAWPATARVIHARVLALREQPYIINARSMGAGTFYLIRAHILPNCADLLLAKAALTVAGAMLAEAGISFLGLGDPLNASWGSMLHAAFTGAALLSGAWWWIGPPLAGISISVMLFYTVGHLITHRTPLSGPPLTLWPQSQAREQETGQIPPPLLDVNNLTVSFPQAEGGDQRVVDGLNLTVAAGEKITVLGATGSGKSMLLLSLLGLLPWGGEVRGEIRINTEHPADMDARRLRTYRGLTVGYIPQNGGVSLNPVLSISRQVGERALVHQGLSRSRARRLARKQLLAVGLPERLCYSRTYVHQLSGGMRQRVLLAMALTANPHLVLADEPTKGLDPDARDAIGRLFKSLDDKTLITVTHDLELARSLEGTITVVFAGIVVESAPADLFFHSPLHPYSSALLAAQPSRGMRVESLVADPDACTGGTGCPYQPFCRQAEARCSERPGLKIFANRWIRCWHHAN